MNHTDSAKKTAPPKVVYGLSKLQKYVIKKGKILSFPNFQSFPMFFSSPGFHFRLTEPKGGPKYFSSQNKGLL